jgi:hypothetical protein
MALYKTKKRKLENFNFSRATRRTIARLKRQTGWTKKAVVEKAILNLDQQTQKQ